jgi:hypothetical protein
MAVAWEEEWSGSATLLTKRVRIEALEFSTRMTKLELGKKASHGSRKLNSQLVASHIS